MRIIIWSFNCENTVSILFLSPIGPACWSLVLLVQPVRYFNRREQVLLHGSTQIPLVAKYHAIMVFPSCIFQIMQVMYIGGSHIKGVYHAQSTAQGVVYNRSSVFLARRSSLTPGQGSYSPLPMLHLLAHAFLQTFTGLESMLNTNSPPSMDLAIDLRMLSPSRQVCFLLWLNRQRVMRLGMAVGHSLPRRAKR